LAVCCSSHQQSVVRAVVLCVCFVSQESALVLSNKTLHVMSLSLVDVLARRSDSTSSQYRECIESILEKQFIESHNYFDYDLVPDMVLSTIAIAVSSDGALVASTHGDHTVKIFQHDTGKLIHVSSSCLCCSCIFIFEI
jgi:hypothetical protein